eukprot:COSAG03_NODE_4753_length_1443_cov_4.526786_1_plen_213_part_00
MITNRQNPAGHLLCCGRCGRSGKALVRMSATAAGVAASKQTRGACSTSSQAQNNRRGGLHRATNALRKSACQHGLHADMWSGCAACVAAMNTCMPCGTKPQSQRREKGAAGAGQPTVLKAPSSRPCPCVSSRPVGSKQAKLQHRALCSRRSLSSRASMRPSVGSPPSIHHTCTEVLPIAGDRILPWLVPFDFLNPLRRCASPLSIHFGAIER